MILAPTTSVTITAAGATVSGEAYFVIVPHSARPFAVRTDNAIVQVLGTHFSVRRYPNEMSTRVVVEDGRVALRALRMVRQKATTKATVMSARMLATVTDSGITVMPGIVTEEYVSWTHGLLVFNRVALGTVIAELVRVYDADIRIADTTLAKQVMQVNVSVDEDSLTQVLDLICTVSNAHYTRRGRTYVLLPGRTATHTPRAAPAHHDFFQPEPQYGR
jgi:ferric-dicitrate binding protein FerR (iron transport regulator)